MINKIILGLMLSGCLLSYAQNTKPTLYEEYANANAMVAEAITKAKSEGKHVMLQIGGNWCSWCIKFHEYVASDSLLNALMDQHYVKVMVNYSPANKNLELLESLGFPQRFGFPAFVILNQEGKRIHTQDSALLEKGMGYDKNKIKGFLKNWSAEAIKPDQYRE